MLGSLFPFHHGGATDEDANLLQRFNDSDGGVILGTFLHTTGALLFTAGIALYLYQARLVKSAKAQGALPSLRYLPFAHAFNIFGIGANGLGGLMRLYESDHPGIDQLATSTWVQVLLIKHLFLIVGVGLAGYLTIRTHLLAQADDAPRNFFRESPRITSFAIGSFVTILLASVLGAVASNVDLAAEAAAMEEGVAAGSGTGDAAADAATVLRYYNASGEISGTPVQPGRASASIPVPEDAREVWIELTWQNAQAATLNLTVFDADKKPVVGKLTNGATRVTFVVQGVLPVGVWEAVVGTTQAAKEPYRIVGRVTTGPVPNSLEQTVTVQPRAGPPGTPRFFEVNLNIKLGQRFTYTWEVLESTEKLEFNVHYHESGGRTVYPVQGSWNQYSGAYVHETQGSDGVSLMWENANTTPLRVHYRIVGEFTFHSSVPPSGRVTV